MTKLQSCTDDELITELENRGRIPKFHRADIRLGDFGMQHTMRCGAQLSCPIHLWLNDQFVQNRGLSPFDEGIYTLKENKGKVTMKRVKS